MTTVHGMRWDVGGEIWPEMVEEGWGACRSYSRPNIQTLNKVETK